MDRKNDGTFAKGHIGYRKGTGWKNSERTCKCGKVFNPRKKLQKSCSQHCAMLGQKRAAGHKVPESTKRTRFKKGHVPWSKGTKGIVQGYWRGKKRPEISGEGSKQWKGGVTSVNERVRKSLEYKLWRESVFERDNYTCVFCGERGGDLQADHIKRFSDYPELRLVLENGRTLCKPCHLKTDTYGTKKK